MTKRKCSFYLRLVFAFLFAFIPLLTNLSVHAANVYDLSVAKEKALRGGTVNVPVTMNSGGEVRGLQFDIWYDRSMGTITDVTVGKDSQNFYVYYNNNLQLNGKTYARIMIANMSKNLPSGQSEIAILQFQMADQGPIKTDVTLSNVVISDGNAQNITASFTQNNGEISLDDSTPPTITLTPTPTDPTQGEVNIQVDADGTGSKIVRLKWAAGDQNESYFQNGGTIIDLSNPTQFTVSASGDYTVYAEDELGNQVVQKIPITNIDKAAPMIAEVEDGKICSALHNGITWTDDHPTSATLNDSPYAMKTPILNDGVYKLIVTDAAGNSTEVNFTVDATPPSINNVVLSPTSPTRDQVKVSGTAEGGTGTKLVEIKWEAEQKNAEYFTDGNGQSITIPGGSASSVNFSFDALENGTYTVYAKDEAGNVVVKDDIQISNIDKTPPTLTDAKVEDGKPDTVKLTFSENVKLTDTKGFTVKAGVNTIDIKSVSGSGTSELILMLNGSVKYGQTIVLSYDVAEGNVTDHVENKLAGFSDYSVGNEVKDENPPTIDLTKSAIDLVKKGVTVTAELDGTGSDIVTKKYAKGKWTDAASFPKDSATDLPAEHQFLVTENGYYTVYAKDQAGNEAVKSILVIVKGNVNQDFDEITGKDAINVLDLDLAGNYVVGNQSPTSMQHFIADMNNDDELNVLDWVAIALESFKDYDQ